MSRNDKLAKAVDFINTLRVKYQEAPVIAYVTGALTTNERISYEIIRDEFAIG